MQNTRCLLGIVPTLLEKTIYLTVRTIARCLLVTRSALITHPSAHNETIFYENMLTVALLKLGHKHKAK
jgi:hypothetical protein